MFYAKFFAKRFVAIVITLAAVIAISYIMMYCSPGGFMNTTQLASSLAPLAAQDPAAYQKLMEQFQLRYGLNLPLWHQVLLYEWHTFTLNFGNSMQNPTLSIMSQLKTALPISVILAFSSVVLSVVVGIPMGIIAAIKRNTWVDYLVTTLSMFGQAIPSFVLAVIFVLLFGVEWQNVLPVTGWGTVPEAVLPVVSLAAGNIGVVARYMRGSLIETMRQDFIRTAKAKGVKYWPLVLKHGVKNSLTALITVIGPQFAFSVVGAVWVENIFAIPGLGKVISTAFTNFDFPLAITAVFILGATIMLTNLAVDVIYAVMDPRVKLQ
ncbi:peptide/nickel transport system permease protein [Alicyclobacillus hesperidum]|uniref:Peptide/nickel transport system permease protein n=1 Tax=Alicyclobacillus hesperidum TaxID=89784 RepID=A0A1H2R6I2_9BACL|nr:ABC transporter permease [Alicyclobacillus hesperidum]SDW14279.1 peptide/nickel transport system permease protein [Alicyclobacillus hesperidum]